MRKKAIGLARNGFIPPSPTWPDWRLIDVRAQDDGRAAPGRYRPAAPQSPAGMVGGFPCHQLLAFGASAPLGVGQQDSRRRGLPTTCMFARVWSNRAAINMHDLVDERNRAVLEFARGRTFSVDVGGFRDSLSASSSAGAYRACSAAHGTAAPPRRPTARSTSTPHCPEPRD